MVVLTLPREVFKIWPLIETDLYRLEEKTCRREKDYEMLEHAYF